MQCLRGELAYLFFLAQSFCLQSFGSGLFVVEGLNDTLFRAIVSKALCLYVEGTIQKPPLS